MRLFFCAMAVLCMSASVYAGGEKMHGKPRSPLQVSISPVQSGLAPADIKPGDAVELKIAATSFVDADELNINIELQGGVELLSGAASWKGPAIKGEAKSLLITVRAPKHGKGIIRARISMSPSAGASFAAEAEYHLGQKAEKPPVAPPVKKKDSKGREIMEHRVD